MRKLIAILAALIVLTCAGCGTRNLYPAAGTVVIVDNDRDLVVWEDNSGRLWSFWGAEDWMEGDGIACIMDSLGTDSVYDDEIVSARYTG